MPDRITAMIQIGAVLALVGLAIICWAVCHVAGNSTPDDPSDDNEGDA